MFVDENKRTSKLIQIFMEPRFMLGFTGLRLTNFRHEKSQAGGYEPASV